MHSKWNNLIVNNRTQFPSYCILRRCQRIKYAYYNGKVFVFPYLKWNNMYEPSILIKFLLSCPFLFFRGSILFRFITNLNCVPLRIKLITITHSAWFINNCNWLARFVYCVFNIHQVKIKFKAKWGFFQFKKKTAHPVE